MFWIGCAKAGDAIDQGVVISQLIHETVHGYLPAAETGKLREEGRFTPLAFYLDALSVFTAINVSPPPPQLPSPK